MSHKNLTVKFKISDCIPTVKKDPCCLPHKEFILQFNVKPKLWLYFKIEIKQTKKLYQTSNFNKFTKLKLVNIIINIIIILSQYFKYLLIFRRQYFVEEKIVSKKLHQPDLNIVYSRVFFNTCSKILKFKIFRTAKTLLT